MNIQFCQPNLAKLSLIVKVLGYINYIDFINSNTEAFNFNDLKINMNSAKQNTLLLDRLVGCWYSYNRNLPDISSSGKRRTYLAFRDGNDRSETTVEYFMKEVEEIIINISGR